MMGLNKYYSNNLIIQHSKPFILKGFVAEETNIEVVLTNQATNKVFKFNFISNKDYNLDLGTYKPSFDKYQLNYFENNNLIETINNISFGEVILLAGQSNMALSAYHLEDYDELIEKSKDLDIRYITMSDTKVDNNQIFRPSHPLLENPLSKWVTIKDDTKGIYGIGLGLSIALSKSLNMPIGLIQTAVGGCSIDSYLPYDIVNENQLIKEYLIKTDKLTNLNDYNKKVIQSYTTTSGIYNEKIFPLSKIEIASVIWYQGENSVLNQTSANYYYEALKTLLSHFKQFFNNANLKIITVNITENFYPYAEALGVNFINEAINKVSSELNNVYSVSTYDQKINWQSDKLKEDSNPIHPINKTYISNRISEIYLNNVKSPIISSYKPYLKGLLVTIDNVYEGLIKNSNIYGFQIANENNKLISANAEIINNNQIYVYSKHVLNPQYLTYAFYSYNYDANVYNSYGLPMEIYRSSNNQLNYFANYAFQRLNDEKMYVHYFAPILGESKDYLVFKQGKINNQQQLEINLKDKELHIKHKTKVHKQQFFGPQFKVSIPNISNNLSTYDYIDLEISASNETRFYGIIFESNGQRYLLKNKDEELFVNLNTNKSIYTICLNKAYNAELSQLTISNEIIDSINEAQLLFSSNSDGEIIISEIQIY